MARVAVMVTAVGASLAGVLLSMSFALATSRSNGDETQTTPAPAPTQPVPTHAPVPVSGSVPVSAPPAAEHYAHPREPRRRWYGWQILAGDGTAVTMLFLAARFDSETLAWSAVAAYAFGGPIIHWSHGNVGTGFVSLALRVGLPSVGAYVGCAADDSEDFLFGRCFTGASLGGFLGYVTAVVVDAAVLAHADEAAPRSSAKARPLVAPTASWTNHGGTIGLQGLF